MYTHVHTCTHTYIHTHVHTHTHVHARTHTHTHTHTPYTHTRAHTCTHTWARVLTAGVGCGTFATNGITRWTQVRRSAMASCNHCFLQRTKERKGEGKVRQRRQKLERVRSHHPTCTSCSRLVNSPNRGRSRACAVVYVLASSCSLKRSRRCSLRVARSSEACGILGVAVG